jgi:preprotein translocase subunit SecG
MGGGGGGVSGQDQQFFFSSHIFYVQLRRIWSLVNFIYFELLLALRSNEQTNNLDCPAAGSCRARR